MSQDDFQFIFQDYQKFDDFLTTGNPKITETALDFLNFIFKANKSIHLDLQVLIESLVTKVMLLNKKSIQEKSQELIQTIFQKDENQDYFFAGITSSLQQKNPKCQIVVLQVLENLLQTHINERKQFFLKNLPLIQKLFENSNKQVRDNAIIFVAHITQKFGQDEDIKQTISTLKKQQLEIYQYVLNNQNVQKINENDLNKNNNIQNDNQNNNEGIQINKIPVQEEEEKVEKISDFQKMIKQEKQKNQNQNSYNFMKSNIFKQINDNMLNYDDIPVQQMKIKVKKEYTNYINNNKNKFEQQNKDIFESQDMEQILLLFNKDSLHMNYHFQLQFLQKVFEFFKQKDGDNEIFNLYWNFSKWLQQKVMVDATLKIVEVYISKVNKKVLKCRSNELIPNLIKCCLYNKNQEQCLQLLNLMFEKQMHYEIFETIVDILENPNTFHKLICAAIQTIQFLLKNWGIRRMQSLAPFLKQIEKLASDKKPEIRYQCKEFYLEAYQWLGNSLKLHIQNLKQIQFKEICDSFNQINLKEMVPIKCPEDAYIPYNDKIVLIDLKQKFVDDADIQMKQDQIKNLIGSQQNQNQKEILNDLLKDAMQYEQLTSEHEQILFNSLSSLLYDQNCYVIISAINVIEEVAQHLKNKFKQIAINLLPLLFDKFNDKSVPNDIILRNLVTFQKKQCLEFHDFIEEIKKGFVNSNSDVKGNSILLLQKLIEADMEQKKYAEYINLFIEDIKQLIKDKSHEIKISTINLLARIMQVYNENIVMEVLKLLKKRETKRLERSLEKFWHITEMRENKEQYKEESIWDDPELDYEQEQEQQKSIKKIYKFQKKKKSSQQNQNEQDNQQNQIEENDNIDVDKNQQNQQQQLQDQDIDEI